MSCCLRSQPAPCPQATRSCDSYGARAAADWWSFTVWLIVLDSIAFVAVARAIRGPLLWPQIGTSGLRTAMAGALGAGSFVVFIWALNRNPVAVVVAFRECSVVFATLIGIWVLKETVSSRRLVAVGLITAGLILIAAGAEAGNHYGFGRRACKAVRYCL